MTTATTRKITGVIYDKGGAVLNVKHPDFGAKGDGTTDDTAAIQAAIDVAEAAGWGCVFFPIGTYLITNTLNVEGARTRLMGAGRYVTQLVFKPSSAKACIKFQHSNTALVLYQCSISHLSFIGHGTATAVQKIAIDAYDTSSLLIYDVTVQTWTGNSGSAATPSTAFRSNGREATTVNFVDFSCERPFWLRANANSATLDADSFTFWDVYCTVQGANEAAIEIDSQIGVFNLTIGGRWAMVQGKYGIHWNSTGAMRATAQNIRILGGRFEQATAAGGCAIYWTAGTNNLLVENVGLGGVTNTNMGAYIRNVVFPVFNSCSYPGSGVTLDVDGTTINTIKWIACYWAAGSTATLTGLTQLFRDPRTVSGAPLAPTETYISTSAATLPAVKLVGGALDHKSGTLADDASVTLYMSATGATVIAGVRVLMTETGGTHKRESAFFIVGDNGATKESGTAATTVGDVDTNLCLIYTSANSITVKNRLGGTMNYKIWTTYDPA